ncbi:hypothetical protein [Silvibacterium sp.]|uniref:hypothetical protein n=1 Tax=Silvibacterium sp. TaxID=1964179 RepID=UPI0039E4259B
MNRRYFLRSAAASALAAPLAHALPARAMQPGAIQPGATQPLTITLNGNAATKPVPRSFIGLSYELAQLTEPAFFSKENHGLIAAFHQLSPQGVLRLGGNSSEFCWFQDSPSTPAPKLHVPTGNISANWMPHRLFAISPQAVDNLAGFLDATGWQVIYGVNFGNSSPERAAVEAAYAAKRLGSHLIFFQIGNEPDFYRDSNNGTRPAGWDFPDYAREWLAFARAIAAAVPGARFGGPDVGASSDWITRFAAEVAPQLGDSLVAVTGHYYAEGPPDDPRVTSTRLLAGNPAVRKDTEAVVAAAEAHHLVYRMTEGNSCYRGGKPGMSNAFASSLWAGDYLLELASLGCAGVNLHGGDSRFLTASLGDHTPGRDVAKGHETRSGGFYTPIDSELNQPVRLMPIAYGMLIAQQFAGATMLETSLQTEANITAYAARTAKGYLVAVFNKDESTAADLAIALPADAAPRATAWRLEGPALDATTGITLAGASLDLQQKWAPRHIEKVQVRGSSARIHLSAASAALVFLESFPR